MLRIALGIEYDGAHYSGWQSQKHCPSIQNKLESSLSRVANHPIALVCAGRTDAGVHATGQVVHFDTSADRVIAAWTRGANTFLPPDIRVRWAKQVSMEFNARRTAMARRYCYVIANDNACPALLYRKVTWILSELDVEAMQAGANYLLGEHDFSSFRAAQCQAKSPCRVLSEIQVQKQGKYIFIEITANAFLHHMVRNIVGTLILVGKGKYQPCWVQEVLRSKKRAVAGFTAPADGLYLLEVKYPPQYEIPYLSHPWMKIK